MAATWKAVLESAASAKVTSEKAKKVNIRADCLAIQVLLTSRAKPQLRLLTPSGGAQSANIIAMHRHAEARPIQLLRWRQPGSR
jgi:hypothetical protein